LSEYSNVLKTPKPAEFGEAGFTAEAQGAGGLVVRYEIREVREQAAGSGRTQVEAAANEIVVKAKRASEAEKAVCFKARRSGGGEQSGRRRKKSKEQRFSITQGPKPRSPLTCTGGRRSADRSSRRTAAWLQVGARPKKTCGKGQKNRISTGR